MNALAAQSFTLKSYNTELKRLKGGVFLKKLFKNWARKEKSRKFLKSIFLYSGHDSTIANILSVLNVWEENVQIPDFATAILIELSKYEVTQEYGIEVCCINIIVEA